MTKEERAELEKIREKRGRYEPELPPDMPVFKDDNKHKTYSFRLFGREIKIKVSNSNK